MSQFLDPIEEEEEKLLYFKKKKFIVGLIIYSLIFGAIMIVFGASLFIVTGNYCSCDSDDEIHYYEPKKCSSCIYKKEQFKDVVNGFSPKGKGIKKGKACWSPFEENSPQLYILLNGPTNQYQIPWQVSCRSDNCTLCYDTMAIPVSNSYSTYETDYYTPSSSSSYDFFH